MDGEMKDLKEVIVVKSVGIDMLPGIDQEAHIGRKWVDTEKIKAGIVGMNQKIESIKSEMAAMTLPNDTIENEVVAVSQDQEVGVVIAKKGIE